MKIKINYQNEFPESSINRRVNKLETLLFYFVGTDIAAFQDLFPPLSQH